MTSAFALGFGCIFVVVDEGVGCDLIERDIGSIFFVGRDDAWARLDLAVANHPHILADQGLGDRIDVGCDGGNVVGFGFEYQDRDIVVRIIRGIVSAVLGMGDGLI